MVRPEKTWVHGIDDVDDVGALSKPVQLLETNGLVPVAVVHPALSPCHPRLHNRENERTGACGGVARGSTLGILQVQHLKLSLPLEPRRTGHSSSLMQVVGIESVEEMLPFQSGGHTYSQVHCCWEMDGLNRQ